MVKNLFRLLVGIFVIGLAIPGISQQNTEKKWPQYEGIWQTDRGQLALWQAEDAVWGIYGSGEEVGGHAESDGTYRFILANSGKRWGTGWVKLDEEGKKFDGQWIKDLDIGTQGTWHGELIGPNQFKVGDKAALKWEPGQVVEPAPVEPAPLPPVTEPTQPAPTEPPEASTTPPETAVQQSLPHYAGDVVSAWTGTWETGKGLLAMLADKKTISGTFGETGKITGTINGATANVTWSETGADGTESNGSAVFWLNEDGKSFRGTYDLSTQVDIWLVWSGKKVSDVAPESTESTGGTEPAVSGQ